MKKLVLLCLSLLLIQEYASGQTNKVVIETEYGNIVMELYDNTPKHRDNFLKLVGQKFFDSTLFHRVIPQFVVQGGDPDSKNATPGQALGEGDLGYLVPAEINDSNYHRRGAVGMARDDNPKKESSACQFYIVTGKPFSEEEVTLIGQRSGRNFTAGQREVYRTQGGTPHLDGNYTVFGYVTEGMDIVDKIAAEPRNSLDRPHKNISMKKVYLQKKKRKKRFFFF